MFDNNIPLFLTTKDDIKFSKINQDIWQRTE